MVSVVLLPVVESDWVSGIPLAGRVVGDNSIICPPGVKLEPIFRTIWRRWPRVRVFRTCTDACYVELHQQKQRGGGFHKQSRGLLSLSAAPTHQCHYWHAMITSLIWREFRGIAFETKTPLTPSSLHHLSLLLVVLSRTNLPTFKQRDNISQQQHIYHRCRGFASTSGNIFKYSAQVGV